MKKSGLIKRFMPYYKPYKFILSLDLLCSLVYAAAGIVFPMLVRHMLNNYVSADYIMWSNIGLIAAIMVGLKLLEVASNYFMLTVGHTMGARLEADMREQLFSSLLEQGHSFYDNNKVGDMMSRVNNDLFQITEFSHHCPEEVFIGLVKLVGIFTYLMMIHVSLTLIVFAGLPIMIVIAIVFNKKLRRVFRRQREQVSVINSQLEDTLSGISVVKSFANEEMEMTRFQEDNNNFVNIKRKTYKYMGAFHVLIKWFTGVFYLLTVIAGAIYISLGEINTVDLLTYLLYVSTLMLTVEVIMNYTEQFQQAMSGFARYVEVIDEPVTISDNEQEEASETINFDGEIKFDNVTFKYEKKGGIVLRNMNFTVKSGENIAIVGPSGAGKTTIANLIPRFYDIQSGDILIGNKSIKTMSLKKLRENIGVVQQNVYLFNGSVKKNILYGRPNATMDEVISAAKKAGADEFISKLPEGYDTDCGEKGVKLSGGQKQRIAIARVFLKNPPILILDEATSALDNESERLVQKSLEKLSKGRTTLTIAHRLTTIKAADRILVVTDKGIEEQGTHYELLKKGTLYASLYELYDNI